MTRLCLYEGVAFADEDFGLDLESGVEIHIGRSPKHTATGELVDGDLPGADAGIDEPQSSASDFLEEGRG